MNLRKLFNVVFVALFSHAVFVCAVVESVDAASFHTDSPDDADVVRQNQQVRSEHEELLASATELLNEVVTHYFAVKEVGRCLEEMDPSKAKNEDSRTERIRSMLGWWEFRPFLRWIKEEEEVQVISDECHTLGCCLSTMLQLWLLILQQIWSITIILCSDPLSWIESGLENVRATIPIITDILDLLLFFLMLNFIAYVLLKLKSVWVRIKSFVLPIFKLPVFVVFWSLSCFVFNLLKKTAVRNKERSQVSKSQITKLKKELKELTGTVNDLKKQQEDNSMSNEFKALTTQLQQLKFDNRPALPATENQSTVEYGNRTIETENPFGDFNNVEEVRRCRRNGSYRATRNLRRTIRMSVEDELESEY